VNPDVYVVLGVIFLAAVLFASEKLRVDLVALLVMAILLGLGIVSPADGISGFSNEATVTVGAMFVLSAGLQRTGTVEFVGQALAKVGRSHPWMALSLMMVAIGVISAFVNNTAAMAVFLPVVLKLARDTGKSPSLMLMPVSFAAILGGTCTLIGTSTNILVSSIASRSGQKPFGMFEFSPLGLVMFGAGMVYMLTVGVRLVPNRRRQADLLGTFAMKDYLLDIVLGPRARSVGKTLQDSPLVKELNVEVLEVIRGATRISRPSAWVVVQDGDVLRVRCDVERVKKLSDREGIEIKSDAALSEENLSAEDMVLVEVVVAPSSDLIGRSLGQIGLAAIYHAVVLALRHRTDLLHKDLYRTPLRAGDTILMQVTQEGIDRLRSSDDFVIVSEVGIQPVRRSRILPALLIAAGVVAAAASGLTTIVVSSVIGAVLMVALGCLKMEEAYEAIEWKVIFLLAGVLTLGVALETTGAAEYVSRALVFGAREWGPAVLVSLLYLFTSFLTEVMSNNATAALLAPIAIASAEALGIDARPLLMAVTFAASASFMTPVGYQTNTLIYGPGQYRFRDFFRVGAPLNFMLWILATFLIPRFWPFR
jgi:di/tricarboxylate transporter